MSPTSIVVLGTASYALIGLAVYLIPAFFPKLDRHFNRELPPVEMCAPLWPLALLVAFCVVPFYYLGIMRARITDWSDHREAVREAARYKLEHAAEIAQREEEQRRAAHADRYL